MIDSAYPGGKFCSAVSILISASKIFRRLFSDSIATWCFGAAYIANSVASELDL